MGLEVYDVTVGQSPADLSISNKLRGRRQILSAVDEVTEQNVLDVLGKAIAVHLQNRREILFLKNYVKGEQPILHRTKTYNDYINNKVVVNIANQIITFKSSEFAGEPIQYVSRGTGIGDGNEDEENTIPKLVAAINDMMISEEKQSKDFKLAYEMFTCGVGYRLVCHDQGASDEDYLDEAPFDMYIPESENTFIVKRSDVTRKVLMGVTYVFKDPEGQNVEYTVYTPKVKYVIGGIGNDTDPSKMKIISREKHNFGQVTLVEYPCNPNYMGAFEPVVPLLDSINLTQSNRLDGIEQFVQALMVFDGVDISRDQFLELHDLGAIKLPPTQGSNSGKKLYYLNEQLDQSQTQTLIEDMYKKVLRIVGIPSQGDGNTGDSSNNGAVIMRNGWWDAEARMQETQSMWKASEKAFLKIVLKICADTNTLTGLKISNLEPRFWRQSYEDLLVKTQSFATLRQAGQPAIQAFSFSHLSRDPEADAIVYDEYQRELAEEVERLNQMSDGLPLQENDTVNPTSTQGVQAQAEAEGGAHSTGDREGRWAICPVCGRRFQKHEASQVYDSKSCANKARKNNGVGFGN